ncbi:MAG TPA: copper-binding protein [Gallionellaceae bacterium]
MNTLFKSPLTALILGSSLCALQPALAADMDMSGMDMPHAQQTAGTEAVGVVDEVNAAKGIVTISHEPIKSLNWPAMTMDFVVKDKKMLAKLRKGKKIHFSFVEQHGDYVVTKVK